MIDLDGTLTIDDPGTAYTDKEPNRVVIEALRRYAAEGYQIIVFTARSMRTYSGAVGKINLHTLPAIIDWLKRHDIPHDEVIVGKPWCGPKGFYVDDRAIRPDEFVRMSPEEIDTLLGINVPQ
ncbi:HAD family hydrolase [Xanthobacter agilis]|uniref:hypothetical protein n=1 Tax=Xanthobacter agilis TaxID=47492 RepID=UPI003727C97A